MKIRSFILLVFLVLITTSSTAIISFTYVKNSRSIQDFSKGTIDRISSLIISKIECLLQELQKPTQMAIGFFKRHPHLSLESDELQTYFLEIIKYYPRLYAFYLATTEGSSLMALNLNYVHNMSSFSSGAVSIPENTAFCLLLLDKSLENPKERWLFYNQNLTQLGVQEIPFTTFDPRDRPWYQGALKTGHIYWTDIYSYFPSNEPGISVSNPVFNASGQLIGILGVDLSLHLLSTFLTQQVIGKNGQAFLLNPEGDVILPMQEQGSVPHVIIEDAYQQFKNDRLENFQFKSGGQIFLGAIQSFPVAKGKKWLLAVIDPLSDYFSDILNTQKQAAILSLGILAVASMLVIFVSNFISKPIVKITKDIDEMTDLNLNHDLTPRSNIQEITSIHTSLSSMQFAFRSFAHYVPKEIAKELMKKNKEITLGGEKKNITVFFSDIVGFTTLAEKLPLESLTSLLSAYFDLLSKVILKHHGSIDKYIGDSIMALWGAPEEIANPEQQACLAALFCKKTLRQFNLQQTLQGNPELITLIGINSGPVIVGNFGTSERMNYTVLGDAVNTASRLQALNKIYHTQIILGENVVGQLNNQFCIRPLDYLEVRGKTQKMTIYELLGTSDPDCELHASSSEKELAEQFQIAYKAFQTQEFQQAQNLFKKIQTRYPEDVPTQIFLQRLSEFI